MRNYPRNSPRAAARIVATTLIADGKIKEIELTALEKMDACGRLGLAPLDLHEVVHDLCEDLLDAAAASGRDDCRIAPSTITAVLADVDDPALRRSVFELCTGVARADRMMHEGELILLIEAISSWQIDRHRNGEIQPPAPLALQPAASTSIRGATRPG